MPRLSFFYGIMITMYWREGHHSRPHCHARYGEYKASLDFAGEMIVDDLPQRALAAWQFAVNEEPLDPIDPSL
jgi:hypothetical protein